MNGEHLPSTWITTTFGDIAEIAANLVDPSEMADLPHIAPDNIQRDTGRLLPFRTIAEDKVISPKHRFLQGQLLYSKIRPYLNKCVMAPFEGACSADMYPVSPRIVGGYLHQYILTKRFVTDVTKAAGSRSVLPKVNQEQLVGVKVPVAPLPEQHRIVAALDAYLSRLDAAAASLERARRNLGRYRASVLQAAVEGRLVPTEASLARAEGRDFEPADTLLARVLVERKQRWLASGKRGKYEEPVAPDVTGLPELPEGWCWATVDGLTEVKGGITKNQARRSSELREVPYLRVANVQRGHLSLGEVATILASEAEIAELRLECGDVLFNEGGDRDKLGRGWIWSGELAECIHQNHVFRARPVSGGIVPKLLSYYGNSAGQRYFFAQGTQTTNLASINMTKLRGLPVSLPPHAEQTRIVAEVDRLLSVAATTEATVTTQLARVQRLRQAVLKWAFEGKLVDQDPNDEPASVLLERIRAERAGSEAPGKRRARGRQVAES